MLLELIVRAFFKLQSKQPVLHPTERYLNSQLTTRRSRGFYWRFDVISR